MTAKTEYYCKDCGKQLLEDEKPCSKCGSVNRHIEIELKDRIALYDSVETKLKVIKKDSVFLFDSLRKASKIIFVVTMLFVIFCIMPLIFYTFLIDYNRVLIASIGILTFISIFYSIIISPHGKKIFDSIISIIESENKELEKIIKERIKESKEIDIMYSEVIIIQKELKKRKNLTTLIDIGYILILAVTSFFLTIVLSLFQHSILNLVAYLFFSIGISFSIGIVLEWRILNNVSQKFKLES